ncbi:MAG TPA: hypothetical protein VGO03_00265 [Acidimicrobiia bacterium]
MTHTEVPEGDVAVYVARDAGGVIRFVGYTRNLERRAAEHASRGWRLEEALMVRTDVATARSVEQAIINRLGRRFDRHARDEPVS